MFCNYCGQECAFVFKGINRGPCNFIYCSDYCMAQGELEPMIEEEKPVTKARMVMGESYISDRAEKMLREQEERMRQRMLIDVQPMLSPDHGMTGVEPLAVPPLSEVEQAFADILELQIENQLDELYDSNNPLDNIHIIVDSNTSRKIRDYVISRFTGWKVVEINDWFTFTPR